MNEEDRNNLDKIVLSHIKASGPVAFHSVAAYVLKQFPLASRHTCQEMAAESLIRLALDRKIDRYDGMDCYV